MLNSFEGADVVQSTIRITRAGDGLSEALNVEPVEYHMGDVVHIVLRCRVGPVQFKPVKDTDVAVRVHSFVTEMGTVVDASLVETVLDEQTRKIDAAKGVDRLPFDPDADDE